jgi:hypothetical protein
MGLWLKCPGCHAQNPLPLRSCPHCGQDLSKLTAAQRVYVMGPAAAPTPAAGPAASKPAAAAKPSITPSPEADAATKPAKKAKRTTKKKK